MIKVPKKIEEYSTDGKVRHFSTEKDINIKLGEIIGKKFVDYRKIWDAANRFEIVTEFPLYLDIDLNQIILISIIALIISTLVSYWPSSSSSKILPSEALKYE